MCQVQRLDDYETFAFENCFNQTNTTTNQINSLHEWIRLRCESHTVPVVMYVESLHMYIHSYYTLFVDWKSVILKRIFKRCVNRIIS